MGWLFETLTKDVTRPVLRDVRFGLMDGDLGRVVKETNTIKPLWGGKYATRLGANFRLPANVSDHPIWNYFHKKLTSSHRKYHTKETSFFLKEAEDILSGEDLTGERGEQFFKTVEGLKMGIDGTYRQTYDDAPSHFAGLALQFRKRITDPIFTMLSGLDPRVPLILEKHGLPTYGKQGENILKKLRLIQMDHIEGSVPVPDNETLDLLPAARELKGYLNFDQTHDLRIEFVNGYISHQPIENERAVLKDIERRFEHGEGLPEEAKYDLWSDTLSTLGNVKKRLKELDAIEQKLGTSALPGRDFIPKKRFYGHTTLQRFDAPMLLETNIAKILDDYVTGAMHKRYMDVVQHEANQSLRQLSFLRERMGERVQSLEAHIQETVNALRGVRAWREDQHYANTLDRFYNSLARTPGFRSILKERPITVKDISRYTSDIMLFQSLSKVMLPLIRFPLVNLTQTVATTYGVVGGQAYMKGLMHAFTKEGWEAARVAGVIGSKSQFFQEVQSAGPILHRLIESLQINRAANFTESMNRVISYWAGRAHLLETGAPTPLIKGLSFKKGAKITEEMLDEYGQMMVDLTQFSFASSGKPLFFVGSATRRLAGQFKTFPIAYASLYTNAIRYKQWGTVGRMTAAALFFGGMPAIPIVGGSSDFISSTLKRRGLDPGEWYYGFRNEMKKRGIELPVRPPTTGIGFLSSLGQPIGDLFGADFPDVPIDIRRSFEGLTVPGPGGALDFALGPTFGGLKNMAVGAGEAAGSLVQGEAIDPQSLKKIGRAIAPSVVAALEALNEVRLGGYHSKSGTLLASRPYSHVLMRGLNLAPSIRSIRWQLLHDLENAAYSSSPYAIQRVLQSAEAQGVHLSSRDIAWAKGRVTGSKEEPQF